MYYVDGASRDGSGYFAGRRIKIENGEQFVPLYLATISMTGGHAGSLSVGDYNGRNRSLYIHSSISNRELTSVSDKERKLAYDKVKESLRKELLAPIPKEYACNFNEGQRGSFTHSYIRAYFAGQTLAPQTDAYYHVRPGLFCKRIPQIQYLVTGSKYKMTRFDLPAKIAPLALTIVKAKHIPLVRAAFKLNKPLTVPYTDIENLVATNANTDASYLDHLAPLIKETSADVHVKYVSPEVIMSYLQPTVEPARDATEALLRAQASLSKVMVEPYI